MFAPHFDSSFYITLLKQVLIAQHLKLILVTEDLAIHSKAQHILSNIGMHLTMEFNNGGLQEIISSSGLFTTSSASPMP